MLQIHFLCILIQIFRSIDSNSVKGFPKDPKEATMKVRKISGKGVSWREMCSKIWFYWS